MNTADIILELMKHMHTVDMLKFSMCCKRNYKLLDIFINKVDDEEFFDRNNISILSRSYELYYKLPLLLTMIPSSQIKYNCRSKKEYIKYLTDGVNIKIYTNRIKVSGIKSRLEIINIINKFSEQIFTKHNLIPISTTLTFNKNLIHSRYKIIYVNNRHSHLVANILRYNLYKGQISYISTSKKIDVTYNKFKIFYLTYTCFIS